MKKNTIFNQNQKGTVPAVNETGTEVNPNQSKGQTPYLPGNAFMYIKACNTGESLYKRK
jgi:hypothetical protein